MKGFVHFLQAEVYYMIVIVLFNFRILKSQTESSV